MAATSRAARPACLLIEGRHMRMGLEAAGNPAFRHVVRALELTFHCRFVRKEWHEGTPDGRPSAFHLEISSPEAGHVTPKIRSMKLQTGLAVMADGQKSPHRVAIRIEKGVDVALSLAMVERSFKYDDYELLVVVTGDGDLEAALEASAATRRTYVCGLRDGLAPALHRWVNSDGSRGLYLEDVLANAWALMETAATSGSSSSNATAAAMIGAGPGSPPLPSSAAMAAPTVASAPLATSAAGPVGNNLAGHSASPRAGPASHKAPGAPLASSPLRGDLAALRVGSPTPAGAPVESWLAAVMEGNGGGGGGSSKAILPPPGLSAAAGGGGGPAASGEELLMSGSNGSRADRSRSSHGSSGGGGSMSPIFGATSMRLLNGVGYGAAALAGAAGDCHSPSMTNSPAYVGTPTASRSPDQRGRSDDEGSNGPGRVGEAKAGGRRRKSSKLRLKCFAGPFCSKLKDEEHLRRTTHPCQAGARCPMLLGPDSPEKTLHMERFLHPCPRGPACDNEATDHTSLFEHTGRGILPLCTKKGCRGGDKSDHAVPHRHVCPHGRNCSFLAHSVADKRVIRHTASFLHPCPWGSRCVAARAPAWNWEHMQSFTHSEPLKPPGKAGVGDDDLGLDDGVPYIVGGGIGNGGGSGVMGEVGPYGEIIPLIAEEGREGTSSSSFDDTVGPASHYGESGGEDESEEDGLELFMGAMRAANSTAPHQPQHQHSHRHHHQHQQHQQHQHQQQQEPHHHMAIFEQQFLTPFAGLPTTDYQVIFRPSQAELASLPGPSPGASATNGSGGGGGRRII